MDKRKKFFLDQHGCAKNQTDAEIIVSFLEKEGFCYVQNPDEADFILINSCGFIQSAKKVLITQRNMTEPEAHRYLQKMSMDAGRSLAETARMVLLFAVR